MNKIIMIEITPTCICQGYNPTENCNYYHLSVKVRLRLTEIRTVQALYIESISW